MAGLICVILFLSLAAIISVVGFIHYVRPAQMLNQLEKAASGGIGTSDSQDRDQSSFALQLLGAVGSLMPPSPPEASLIKKEAVAAGFRLDSAPLVLNGLKISLAIVFLVIGFCCRNIGGPPIAVILIPVFLAVGGYLLPGLVLSRLIHRRQEQIRHALPDALDMLVVCCEAGSGLDQAILNVGREFQVVHRALSEEFALVNMEILAGASRAAALRNLATRTGEDELKKLVAILIQTDRFGTSIADALRTQADFMRVKRRQIAEEKAGKVGVKLVFPIFFFCMPALSIFVMGPGLIQLMANLSSLSGVK